MDHAWLFEDSAPAPPPYLGSADGAMGCPNLLSSARENSVFFFQPPTILKSDGRL